MKPLLLVGAGSCLGGVGRYVLSQFVQTRFAGAFPLGTLGVNGLGCLVLGFVLALSDGGRLSGSGRLLLATGLTGGFTTFSAFSAETLALLRAGRPGLALAYAAGSLALGLLAVAAGYWAGRLAG